ncbi:hypothetical protein EJ06DRAFT_576066 [Trichodelitschia bisporula]|uniref:Uncharacterized protein n=1 Tax=Trichodelitschia bisporula TaxID=703511 RepID=A0A6G1HZG4_9PEZI|nr:hypothetical protein EJ06DRAFT_576066 [Trichodelitschia bisporula]
MPNQVSKPGATVRLSLAITTSSISSPALLHTPFSNRPQTAPSPTMPSSPSPIPSQQPISPPSTPLSTHLPPLPLPTIRIPTQHTSPPKANMYTRGLFPGPVLIMLALLLSSYVSAIPQDLCHGTAVHDWLAQCKGCNALLSHNKSMLSTMNRWAPFNPTCEECAYTIAECGFDAGVLCEIVCRGEDAAICGSFPVSPCPIFSISLTSLTSLTSLKATLTTPDPSPICLWANSPSLQAYRHRPAGQNPFPTPTPTGPPTHTDHLDLRHGPGPRATPSPTLSPASTAPPTRLAPRATPAAKFATSFPPPPSSAAMFTSLSACTLWTGLPGKSASCLMSICMSYAGSSCSPTPLALYTTPAIPTRMAHVTKTIPFTTCQWSAAPYGALPSCTDHRTCLNRCSVLTHHLARNDQNRLAAALNTIAAIVGLALLSMLLYAIYRWFKRHRRDRAREPKTPILEPGVQPVDPVSRRAAMASGNEPVGTAGTTVARPVGTVGV